MSRLHLHALRSSVLGIAAMAALLFVPAGTFDYWQGWTFMAVFLVSSAAVTVYLAIHDPKLLERRMRAGPAAEKETTQKIIMSIASAGFVALLVLPALDHRFGWSPVPPAVSVAGNLLIALGFLVTFLVIRENSFAASTIQVAEGQTVVSTGPYALVRHPMYAGAILLLVGMPLALGSFVGLCLLLIVVPVLLWRAIDEEKVLEKHLPGYVDYEKRVRDRLVPGIW